MGTCGSGTPLSGAQAFNFGSGNSVTVNVNTAAGLDCIGVEEMGANHLLATSSGSGETNNWWHISGNVNSGFDVDITLPYASADTNSRVCKWPGNIGGFGWDCDDGTNTSFGSGTVTRTGISSFSDWAVGDTVGPTAVANLQSQASESAPTGAIASILAAITLALGTAWAAVRRKQG